MVVTEEDMEVTEEDMEGMVEAREKDTEDMEEGMAMEEGMDMEEAMGMEEDMDTVVMEVKLPSHSLSHAYNCQSSIWIFPLHSFTLGSSFSVIHSVGNIGILCSF